MYNYIKAVQLYLLRELRSVSYLKMQDIVAMLPGTGIRPGYFQHMLLALDCSHHHSGRGVWLNYREKKKRFSFHKQIGGVLLKVTNEHPTGRKNTQALTDIM